MHECPTCGVDCDCERGATQCEHLCRFIFEDDAKLQDFKERYLRPCFEQRAERDK